MERLKLYFFRFLSVLKKNKAKFSIAGALGLIALLQALGLWVAIVAWFGKTLPFLAKVLFTPWNAPILAWYLASILILGLIYFAYKDHTYLKKVAGEFVDDFETGLSKWDFTGAWKVEEEDKRRVLSVESSGTGGFTKKGFNWTDYEFSFETKVIKGASGWVIRANGYDYFMVQLNLTNGVKLRPHFHKQQGSAEIWLPDENNSVDLSKILVTKPVNLLQWLKVKIVVEGNQVDVYIDENHSLHYLIQSTIGIAMEKKFKAKDQNNVEYEMTVTEPVFLGSYAAGRVGFRCGDGEHAHFRSVKVKPL